jgi:hypothetical protein
MHIKSSISLGCVMAMSAFAVSAQTSVDKSFTTASETCEGVQWSDRAVQMYPTIAEACQSVEVRSGKTYVKFEGEVKKNVDRGKQLVVRFKDGGDMTLTPPAETKMYIDGRLTPVADLKSGDDLTFYIAEDRLAAQFPETNAVTTRYAVVPITQSQPAEEPREQMAALPHTAGFLPLLGLAGCLSFGLAVGMRLLRKQR